ncbi:MAG: hypothetical protein ACR2I7_07960 [Geodermatophilaceae bacterium]
MTELTRRQLLRRAAYVAPILVVTAGGVAYRQGRTFDPVPPMPPRAVFDSYGINTHFSYLGDTATWANTDAAVDWLQELGVGAVRQFLPSTRPGRAAVKKAMDALGVRWCCPILTLGDFTSLDAARAVVIERLDWLQANTDLALLDSLPGPNEPNSEGKDIAQWATLTRWAQQALYEETRRRSAFDDVLVQGPPLNMKGGPREISPDVQALGDLSRWLDRGDAHIYPGAGDPEVAVDERLALLQPIHPGKPVCVSEGGYTTSAERGYTGGAELVSEQAAALYAPKQILVHAIAGRAFFSYEALDEAPPYKDTRAVREGGFGLVRTPTTDPSSWTPKPGFDAIRRTLSLLKDAPVLISSPLTVDVIAATADLRTALFQRSDAKWLLAVWRAVDLYEWDRVTLSGRALLVQPEQVTVTFDEPRPVTVYQPSRQDTPTLRFNRSTFALSVGGELQICEIGS